MNGDAAELLTLPQKFQSAKIQWKILASIFWDQDGMLQIDYLPKGQIKIDYLPKGQIKIDYLPKGQIINAECYSSLLVQLLDF
jgi:hypothetical protein